MGNIHTAGPNEAIVISGGLCGSGKKYIQGSWGWAWWMVSDTEKLNLNIMTVKPKCASVETSKGVPLTVTGVAQLKFLFDKKDKALFARAVENFLGRSPAEIEEQVTETLAGHLRSIVGQMTPEQVIQDRSKFAQEVREIASPDLGKMGIQILSFVIQDIYDDMDYLDSLGRSKTAEVEKNAAIGITDAEKQAEIVQADCDQATTDAKASADTKIDNARRNLETTKAECETEINKAKTEAKLAYDLQKAKEEQLIREHELNIDVIKRQKQTEVEQFEVIRREKELEVLERKPADFDAKKVEILAEGNKQADILLAQAEAERIKMVGQAEADAMEAVGMAEAGAIKLRAQAMRRVAEAAQTQNV